MGIWPQIDKETPRGDEAPLRVHKTPYPSPNTPAYQFHRKNGWERLANMPRKRTGMMCGLAIRKDGRKKIIVAGGLSS